jgi:hypothetical protein
LRLEHYSAARLDELSGADTTAINAAIALPPRPVRHLPAE